MIFFPLNLLLRRGISIQDGKGTGWTPGLVACLSNVSLIDGVKVGGNELVLSTSVGKADVPASPFSSSGVLTVGSSSLAVAFFDLPFFEAESATFFGEMENIWEGDWRCKNQRSNPRWTPKSPVKDYRYRSEISQIILGLTNGENIGATQRKDSEHID